MTETLPWLERTREAAIEPELPVCDPHHHLWVYPNSRYLLDELLADIDGGHRVLSTVYVECQQFYCTGGPVELRPAGETEFVESVAAFHHLCQGSRSGIVAGDKCLLFQTRLEGAASVHTVRFSAGFAPQACS